MSPACVRDLAQTAALALAGLFFVYKAIAGYVTVNMSISIGCRREHMPGGERDWLAIDVRLTKAEFGTVSLHDAQVQIRTADSVVRLPLMGVDRRSYRNDSAGDRPRHVVDWDQRSRESPFINLSPREETSFGCVTEVPLDQPCEVEAAVIGRRRCSWRTGQWRASCVVLPIGSTSGV